MGEKIILVVVFLLASTQASGDDFLADYTDADLTICEVSEKGILKE